MCADSGLFEALNFERGAQQAAFVCDSTTRATDELGFFDVLDVRHRIFFEEFFYFAQGFSHRIAKSKRGEHAT